MSPFPMLRFAAVIVVVGCGVIALNFRQNVPEPRLGEDWKCTRIALLITTCTLAQHQVRATPSQQ